MIDPDLHDNLSFSKQVPDERVRVAWNRNRTGKDRRKITTWAAEQVDQSLSRNDTGHYMD